ncbi:hypothetical protein ACE1CI_06605 [Aerosakkonemataceae cyanobacterium BLCC-F50]|uniref:Uncharacterized protein n=1 Tax=Floridaenema flaviceps BLCC-F50 TaxID=3153642 RepID=A0ABV4XLM2_9CYAN
MTRIVSRRTFGRRAISPALLREQQRVADIFFQNKLLPKAINISDAALTSAQYAALTPSSISQS